LEVGQKGFDHKIPQKLFRPKSAEQAAFPKIKRIAKKSHVHRALPLLRRWEYSVVE